MCKLHFIAVDVVLKIPPLYNQCIFVSSPVFSFVTNNAFFSCSAFDMLYLTSEVLNP